MAISRRNSRLLAIVFLAPVTFVVIVVTALVLRQPPRGNGTDVRDAPKDVPGTATEAQPLTGVLLLRPTREDQNTGTEYWVYVDSQIVKKQLDPTPLDAFGVDLVPGRYNLEIALPEPTSLPTYVNFPFRFESQEITIERGKTAEYKFDVSRIPYRGMQSAGFSLMDGETWQGWMDKLVKASEMRANDYRQDAAPSAMLRVYELLLQSPPSGPVQYIDLPENFGGGRYFDSEQVRRIVAWLQRLYWDSWFPESPYFNKRLPEDIPPELRPTWDQVNAYMAREKAEIARLNEIAKMLDRVPNGND